ncbi:MAG: response regulator [Alphaproteobacteria bacterium]|nr:response regulator [Alphaproteobacteria bacterium]
MASPHDPRTVEAARARAGRTEISAAPADGASVQTLDAPGRGNASGLICVASTLDILVVDDNDRHLDILSTILRGVGHDVETCGSGSDALHRLANRRYGAVVLDMVMPEVNGFVVASEIRECALNRTTPVIACTANVMIARERLARVPGIAAMIEKPIEAAALVMAVERLPFRVRA